MSKSLLIYSVIFSLCALFGCSEDVTLPSLLQVNSQEDLDRYCDKLMETSIFQGSILISEDAEGLDLTCFQNIREITSFLGLESKEAVDAFQNIETIGGEGLLLGGEISDEITLKNLKSVSAISVSSWADLGEVNFPNIETIESLSIGSMAKIDKISGFHKVESINVINMPNSSDTIGELDIFENLKKVNFLSIDLSEETSISPNSFDNLEEVELSGGFSKKELGYTVEDLFPKLKFCPELFFESNGFDLSDFCYLKPHLENDSIILKISMTDDNATIPTGNSSVLAACQ